MVRYELIAFFVSKDLHIIVESVSVEMIPLPKNKNYNDFQGIMTHELGHSLGLAHSDNPDSVMYFPYHSAQYQMTPTKCDIDAVMKLYPK